MGTLTYSLQSAILWANMVKSAYSTYDANTDATNPLTPQNLPDGWQVIANLQSDPVAGLFSEIQFVGYVVGSKADASQIGIVFRGTDGILDWVVDFEAKHVDFTDIPNGGRTEEGFTCMFRSLKLVAPGETETQTLYQFFLTLDPSTTITVTGHSLGGALANLAGVWTAAHYPQFSLELYTFAAPMTGDKSFVTTFDSLVANNFRIFNEPDIVPKVPSALLGYEQVGGGIELNSHNYPNLPHSIAGYHSLDTYLYMLEQ